MTPAPRPSPRTRAAHAMVTGVLWACLPGAHAQVVTLLDRGLEARTVQMTRIGQGRVTFLEAQGGVEQSLPLDTIAAIVDPAWWSPEPDPAARQGGAPAPSLGVVDFTDGRVLVGRPALPPEPADSDQPLPDPPRDLLAWEHPMLGRLEFALEDVRRVRMPGEPAGAMDPGKTDAVLLVNGDRLSGFVERIGREVWVSDSGSVAKVPMARVRQIALVNPPARPTGTMVWLQGGSVIRVEHLGADPQRGLLLGIEPSPGKSRQVFTSPEQVRGLIPAAGRVEGISTLKLLASEPTSGRWLAARPEILGPPGGLLGVDQVLLPGPMWAEWELPEGAARVGGWLVLPAWCREWGDCQVRLSAGAGAELGTHRLSPEMPVVAINAPLPPGARTLRITVEGDRYGPIQDQVILHRFIVVK